MQLPAEEKAPNPLLSLAGPNKATLEVVVLPSV